MAVVVEGAAVAVDAAPKDQFALPQSRMRHLGCKFRVDFAAGHFFHKSYGSIIRPGYAGRGFRFSSKKALRSRMAMPFGTR